MNRRGFLQTASLTATAALLGGNQSAAEGKAIMTEAEPKSTPEEPIDFSNECWLHYTQPAANWNEALPIGNGRLGAMVFGGIGTERIQLNEETLWDGYPMERSNPEALKELPEIRRLLFEEKCVEAEQRATALTAVPGRIKSYQSLGDLFIEFPDFEGLTVKDLPFYERTLCLTTARADSVLDQPDGVSFHRDFYVSAPDDVLIVKLWSIKNNRLNFRVRLTRGEIQDAPDAKSNRYKTNHRLERLSEGSDRLILRGQIVPEVVPGAEGRGTPTGMRFEAHLALQMTGGTSRIEGNVLIVEGANTAHLVLAASTDYRGRDPEAHCRETLAKALKRKPHARWVSHLKAHRKLFDRVTLDIGPMYQSNRPIPERLAAVKAGADDPGLMALYFQYARYLLITSSRPGGLPANLQGIWNEYMNAPWSSDYHTNINVQMNYWPAETTNLAECHTPLFDYLTSLVESGRKTAKDFYDCRGFVVHHLSDIWGFTAPADGIWGIWPMGAAWLCQHLYEHYRFHGDAKFLREKAYPILQEAARFMLDFLVVGPQGTLVTNPSHSPENRFRLPNGEVSYFTYGATMDLMIVHELLTNTIAAAKILKTDADFCAEVQSALGRLQPLQISPKDGRLQEWIHDYDEPEPGHRHISHVYGLHPGEQITLRGTPALAAAIRKTIEHRLKSGGGHTGWSRAWIVNLFARLEDGEIAYENLKALLAKSTLPNLFDDHPPFQIDGNFGGAAGIAEMLLQSHAGEVHLLPALPKAWPDGKVTGLRARGGYTVGMTWQEGQLTEATITADRAGELRLRIQKQDAVKTVSLQAKETYRV